MKIIAKLCMHIKITANQVQSANCLIGLVEHYDVDVKSLKSVAFLHKDLSYSHNLNKEMK